MITYRDMTFCTHRECGKTKCARHLSHVPDDPPLPVAACDFDPPEQPCKMRAEHEARRR